MVTVIATITAKPGLRDKVLAIFNANAPHVLAYRANTKDPVASRVIHVLSTA
jgi:quinol monooxygenase YgiN